MTPEYQFYHGALLHEIITSSGRELRITLRNFSGRPDAFVIDGTVGVLIKFSSARITPWLFTFAKEHVSELYALRSETKVCFIALVCGDDGFVCIRDSDLVEILAPTDTDVASVRVERRPRKMYGLSSSGKHLDGKLARGVQEIVAAINQDNTVKRAAAIPIHLTNTGSAS
jgi:hypothetical protein